MRRSIICLLILAGAKGCAAEVYDSGVAYPSDYASDGYGPVYYNNSYWLYNDGSWYNSPYYYGGWVSAYPPSAVLSLGYGYGYYGNHGYYGHNHGYYGRDHGYSGHNHGYSGGRGYQARGGGSQGHMSHGHGSSGTVSHGYGGHGGGGMHGGGGHGGGGGMHGGGGGGRR